MSGDLSSRLLGASWCVDGFVLCFELHPPFVLVWSFYMVAIVADRKYNTHALSSQQFFLCVGKKNGERSGKKEGEIESVSHKHDWDSSGFRSLK